MHTALWVLAATSLVGAARLPAAPGRTCARRRRREREAAADRRGRRAAGTTVRTVRYYEEVGLLPGSEERATASTAATPRPTSSACARSSSSRSCSTSRSTSSAGSSRPRRRARVIRERYRSATEAAERERLLQEAAGHLDRQLALIRDRADRAGGLEERLAERRERVAERLAELRPSPARRRVVPPAVPQTAIVTRATSRAMTCRARGGQMAVVIPIRVRERRPGRRAERSSACLRDNGIDVAPQRRRAAVAGRRAATCCGRTPVARRRPRHASTDLLERHVPGWQSDGRVLLAGMSAG